MNMKKILLILMIASAPNAFGQYEELIDTLEMLSEMDYEEASRALSKYEYTEEYGINEFVSPDKWFSIGLDTLEELQIPCLVTFYKKKMVNAFQDAMLLRGVLVEEYKDEDNADCYYYEGVYREYLLVIDKKNDIIILTTAKY